MCNESTKLIFKPNNKHIFSQLYYKALSFAAYVATLHFTMKTMPSCLSRFSKQSMSLTHHTGMTSLTQVVLCNCNHNSVPLSWDALMWTYRAQQQVFRSKNTISDATVLSWVCFHAMRHDAASTNRSADSEAKVKELLETTVELYSGHFYLLDAWILFDNILSITFHPSQGFHQSLDGERSVSEIHMWAGFTASMVGLPKNKCSACFDYIGPLFTKIALVIHPHLYFWRISGDTALDRNIHESVSAQIKKNFAKSKWKVRIPPHHQFFTFCISSPTDLGDVLRISLARNNLLKTWAILV